MDDYVHFEAICLHKIIEKNMKKLPLLLIFFTSFCFSQTNRFIYELNYRSEHSQDYRTALMALDINAKNVKFYDYDFVEYDSINKKLKSLLPGTVPQPIRF